jgi:hypothetical protein
MGRIFPAVLSAGLALFLTGASVDAQAETRSQFCGRWDSFCRQCTGAGGRVPRETCFYTCDARMKLCLGNGCYFFNKPRGPECDGQPG